MPDVGPLNKAEQYALKWIALCARYGVDPDTADVFDFPDEPGPWDDR